MNALSGRNGLPPPNHPPPPPPVGQVVKVNVGANVPDVVTPASVYDNMAHIQQVKGKKQGTTTILLIASLSYVKVINRNKLT